LLLFSGNVSEVPAFFTGHFFIENANQIHDTFISFSGWGKGIAVVNDFNIGRYWPVKELNFDFPALLSVLYFFMPLNLFLFSYFFVQFSSEVAVIWSAMQSLCPCSDPSSWRKCSGMECAYMHSHICGFIRYNTRISFFDHHFSVYSLVMESSCHLSHKLCLLIS
jgi:hypothetical protein